MSIAGIIILALVFVAVAIALSGRKGSDRVESKYNPNALWADIMTRAGQRAAGQKAIFREAWSLSGLKTVFASLRTPVVAIMAISAWETGWGKSHAALVHNNLTGISHDDGHGKWVPNDYATIGTWVDGMTSLLALSRYRTAMQQADPSEFVKELGKAGYNSTSTWLSGVLSIVAELSVPEVV